MKIIFLFLTVLFSQGLNINEDIYSRVYTEFQSIENQKISEASFIYPIKESKIKSFYDLLKNNKNIAIYPALGARYSKSGFEINTDIPYSILWLSPGVELEVNQMLFNSLDPIWLSGSLVFYKHSAYGISEDLNMSSSTLGNNNQTSNPIFLYNSNYQYGFYAPVRSDDGNGVDFDESMGYVSILKSNFDITFGKFRSSLGPSVYSNLSISNTIPAFNQFRTYYNYKDKVFFTFIIGDLYSNILDSSIVYQGDEIFSDRYAVLPRKLYNHRIDFRLHKNLRFGMYEQVITLPGSSGSFKYMNPFQLYWSEQHQNNDLDNLQMGFDFDYIASKFRIYGGLIIDEWAPYETFNDESRNWIATQLGLSRIFYYKNWGKEIKGILKFEYSSAEPQVYTHKFEINIPTHHNYPIGLWSGGDSIDKRASLILFVNSSFGKQPFIIDISYQNTRIGQAIYDQDISLLSSENIKTRDLLSLQIKKTLFYNIDYYFKVGYYKTENLYSEDNFLDISTSLLYNIKN